MKALVALLLFQSAYDRGVALLEQGKLSDAVRELQAAVAEKPAAKAWKALGVAYASSQDYSQAAPAFGNACRMDASLADSCYFHARALYALDRHQEALDALERSPRSERRESRWLLARAQALEALHRTAEADNAYRDAVQAMKQPPRSVLYDAPYHYGVFLRRQGRHEEAVSSLKQAASIEAHVELGRVYLQTGRIDEARRELETALAQRADRDAHLLLGKVLMRLGKAAEAEAHFQAATQGAGSTISQ